MDHVFALHVTKGIDHLVEEEAAAIFSHSTNSLAEIEEETTWNVLEEDVYEIFDFSSWRLIDEAIWAITDDIDNVTVLKSL